MRLSPGGVVLFYFFFFSSRRRHTRLQGDWSSDVCSSDLRRTRPRTVTRTRSVDGSSDVFVSSASRLMPTWNGSSSTDMPPNGVTYQCRNVSTGKVGAGLPGAPRLRCTDEKLPAPVFVISVSKIRSIEGVKATKTLARVAF